MDAETKLWVVVGNGSHWSIQTSDGYNIADGLVFGETAHHIVDLHNNWLLEED